MRQSFFFKKNRDFKLIINNIAGGVPRLCYCFNILITNSTYIPLAVTDSVSDS